MAMVGRVPSRRGRVESCADTPVVRAPRVVATVSGRDVILLDPAQGEYYTLNQVGGRVWDLLATTTTASAIADTLREEFDVPPDARGAQLEQDVVALLNQLRTARLLTSMAERHVADG